MRLNDPLVTTFIYEGKEYNIDLVFDNVLDVFDYLNDERLREYERVVIALSLLLGDQDYKPNIDLWNYIFDNFISDRKDEPIRLDLEGNPMKKQANDNKRSIDLDQDGRYIYASFKQAYQIDLFEEQGKMHWDTFRSLLNGLPSNTVMQQIIRIREWKPSKEDTFEQKKQMKELQKIYAIESEVE